MEKGLHYSICVLLAFLLSCSETLEPKPNDYTKVFTGETKKSWQIRSIQLKEEGKSTQTFGLPPCLADDEYVFYANVEKTFEVTNGGMKCGPDEPDVLVTDTWEFSNANATMNIVIPLFADFKLPFFVREVDSQELELEIFLDEDNSSSYRINFRAKDEE